MNNSDCPICKGQTIAQAGIDVTTEEILPFFKKDLLNLRRQNHPFPMRYEDLTTSCFCFGQALAEIRHYHNDTNHRYGTDDKTFLRFRSELQAKFGVEIVPSDEVVHNNPNEACEFNVKYSK